MEAVTDPAKLAATVAEHIRAHPWSHSQRGWFLTFGPGEAHDAQAIRANLEQLGECGTVACAAGWTEIFGLADGEMLTSGGIAGRAQRRLQISDPQARWLFSSVRMRSQVLEALDHIAAGHPERVRSELFW